MDSNNVQERSTPAALKWDCGNNGIFELCTSWHNYLALKFISKSFNRWCHKSWVQAGRIC